MDERFKRLVDRLHPAFLNLRACPPFSSARGLPKKGVYLFSENGKALYVGRSDNIHRRYAEHRNLSSGGNKAAFAFILACEAAQCGKASYAKVGSRKALMENPEFRKAFDAAKNRIRDMEFRAVAEDDPTCQALLEVYCAVALATPYNGFGNH
jgi:hypothetical protein